MSVPRTSNASGRFLSRSFISHPSTFRDLRSRNQHCSFRGQLLLPPRSASTYSTSRDKFRSSLLKARRENPVLLPVLSVAALGAVSLLGLLAYNEYFKVGPQFSAYPTAVEQRLRLALHYTHVQPDPDRATAYFADALKAVYGNGMDPFGKEAMGVRIRFAEMLENFGRVEAAIAMMNSITKDCEEKLSDIDRDIATGIDNGVKLDVDGEEHSSGSILRAALVRGIIQSRVKSASLYASDYIQNNALAKSTLSDAILVLMKESRDPQTNGFTENNTGNFSMAEIAAMLSQMGDLYATTGEEANAVQVYMLAIDPLRRSCNGDRSCKEVQIFSNIASSMDIAMKKPVAMINGRPTTKETMAAARKAALAWADQAIATADKVDPGDRDEICETALLSAQMTKADLLLDSGDKQGSSKMFASLLPILREKRLGALIRVAEDGLRRAKA